MNPDYTISFSQAKTWKMLEKVNNELVREVKFFRPFFNNMYLVMNDNRVLAAGQNKDGELGLGRRGYVKFFEEVQELAGLDIKDIACHDRHAMALTTGGRVLAWGLNHMGQVGVGREMEYLRPVEVFSEGVKQVCCGKNYSLALREDGRVFAWGENNRGEVGINSRADEIHKPKQVKLPKNCVVVHISAGINHSVALTREGKVYGWGENKYNHLGTMPLLPGREPTFSFYRSPVQLNFFKRPMKGMFCAFFSTMFLSQAGELYRTSRKGPPKKLEIDEPVVDFMPHTDIFGLAWTESGRVFSWHCQGFIKISSVPAEQLSDLIKRLDQLPCSPRLMFIEQDEPEVEEVEAIEEVEEVAAVSVEEVGGGMANIGDDNSTAKLSDNAGTTNADGNDLKQPPTNGKDANEENDNDDNEIVSNTDDLQLAKADSMDTKEKTNKDGKTTRAKTKTTGNYLQSTKADGDDTKKGNANGNKEFEPKTMSECVTFVRSMLSHFQSQQNWFNSPKNSDVEFVFPCGKKIKAHRTTLIKTSEHMHQMFSREWHGRAWVYPTDYSYEVYYNYLYFLYSGKLIAKEFHVLVGILHLAKAKVEKGLSAECRAHLLKLVCVENACSFLDLASYFEQQELIFDIIGFICSHYSEIKPTEEFSHMEPRLIALVELEYMMRWAR